MTMHASWTGHLRISLVTVPVRLYTAVSSAPKITLNQIHADCGERLQQALSCPVHGVVPKEEVGRGYEYEKGRYVVIADADLEALNLETAKVIEVTQTARADEFDPSWTETAYWLAPDGPVAEDGFAVLRDALFRQNAVAVGRVVLSGREKAVIIRPADRGLSLNTLYDNRQVRPPAPFFEHVPVAAASIDEVRLAEALFSRMLRPFDPTAHRDRYQEGLLALIKAKLAGGSVPAAPSITEEAPVMSAGLAVALARSLAAQDETAPAPAPAPRQARRKEQERRASAPKNVAPEAAQPPKGKVYATEPPPPLAPHKAPRRTEPPPPLGR